jgi:uncharacterized membrane protein
MNSTEVLVLAFLIGVVAGLRALTAPATVAWAAHRGWLNLLHSPLSLMGTTAAVVLFVLLALIEMVADQLPGTPSRTKAPGLISRIIFGGLSGACIAGSAGQFIGLGIALGVTGGVAGAFAGYEVRTRLVKALQVPDFVVATLEDLVAIGGGLWIASRF